jgi:hypothetical protein
VEADCPSETTHGAPDVGLQSGGLPAPISSSWPHHTTEDSAELYPQPNSVNTTPLLSSPLSLPPHDFHNDIDISPGSPSASSSSFQYCNPNTLVAKGPHGDQPNHALGHSTEVPGLQVDGNDPLCHLIDIEEFQGMSLLTRFQSYLKVFVCERCHCAIWADHLIGHIFNNHKEHLPSTLKKVEVAQAVEKVKKRLHPGVSQDIKLILPERPLPPMPWLGDPILGHRCCLCSYVAGTIGTVGFHGKKHHPQEKCTDEYDTPVWVQRLFIRTQYFIVHPMLQDVGPTDLFAKFYSVLPAQYMNGAFVDGDSVGVSDHTDLSPFLTSSGWVQATDGYSIAQIRAMSGSKIHPEEAQADQLSRIKGLGKKYFSLIRCTTHVDHNLLEALTSWRVRR